MFMLALLGVLLSSTAISTTSGSPLARIHVKFVQPPHIQEHGITTDGARIIEQQSYLSIGRKNSPTNLRIEPSLNSAGASRPFFAIQNSYASIDQNALNAPESFQYAPDYSSEQNYVDPLLLTGERAMLAVWRLYGRRTGLFFSEVPHERALMLNQELRQQNGLYGNLLGSLRPGSSWYRRND